MCRLIPTSGNTEFANGANNPSKNSYGIRRSFQPLTKPGSTASPEPAKFLASLPKTPLKNRFFFRTPHLKGSCRNNGPHNTGTVCKRRGQSAGFMLILHYGLHTLASLTNCSHRVSRYWPTVK